MKKIPKILAASVLGVFLLAGAAMAFPLDAGYSWSNAPFWTNTDLTTGVQGNSQFQLRFEGFSPTTRDSDFGLFYVTDINAPSSPTLFEIFDRAVEPSFDTKTVSFRNDGALFEITLGDPTNPATIWTPFSNSFGFYFAFSDTANQVNPQTYFSYFGLDTDNNNLRNVFTAANAFNEVLIYLDRFATIDGMVEGPVMTVYGNDLTPVPEPGTLLLLGSGILGLGFYMRKRMKG
jgi:hypothetical protein